MNTKLVQVFTCSNGNSKILSVVQVHLTCVLAEYFRSIVFISVCLASRHSIEMCNVV